MLDNVIITLAVDGKAIDVAIPANVQIGMLKPYISDTLARKGISLAKKYAIIHNGKVLPETESLFNLGIWDGSFLTFV